MPTNAIDDKTIPPVAVGHVSMEVNHVGPAVDWSWLEWGGSHD